MTHGTLADASSSRLLDLVRGVRRRWRLARVLRGAAIALGALLATVVIFGAALDRFSYPPTLVVAGRILVAVLAAALVGWYVVRPLLPRPRDTTVARYFEEHAPSLDGALISAVEVSQPNAEAVAPTIATHVRRTALERSRALADGRGVDAAHVWQAGGAVAAATVVLLALLLAGPEQLRHGIAALLTPWQSADAVNPYRVDVTPGDATVAPGATVVVAAHTV